MSNDQPKSYILFVANISCMAIQQEVLEVFKPYGHIQILHLNSLGKKRGTTYAFIQYADMRDAFDAFEALNASEFKGKRLRIEYRVGCVTDIKKCDEGADGRQNETVQQQAMRDLQDNKDQDRQVKMPEPAETLKSKVEMQTQIAPKFTMEEEITVLKNKVQMLEKRLGVLESKSK